MLVDSGTELSLISLKIGQDLGYSLGDAESTLLAEKSISSLSFKIAIIYHLNNSRFLTINLLPLTTKTNRHYIAFD